MLIAVLKRAKPAAMRSLLGVLSVGLGVLFLAGACSSFSSSAPAGADAGDGTSTIDPVGDDGGATDATADAADGDAADTHVGWKARQGTTPGDVVPSVSLQGYRASSSTLTTIAITDYLDKSSATRDAVVVILGAEWDLHTANVVDAAQASTKRIATLVVLGQGAVMGQSATSSDLSAWRASHPGVDNALDAGFAVFDAWDKNAVPYVMLLDARTLEIAYASVGELKTAALDAQVDAITSRPPAY